MSKYEAMRTNPDNWKMGIVYYCVDDPRVVVRNLSPFGWAWNFGHPKVYLTIALAIFSFFFPPYLAWRLGVRSVFVIGLIMLIAFVVIVYLASLAAKQYDD